MYLFILECTWYFSSTLGLHTSTSTTNILNSKYKYKYMNIYTKSRYKYMYLDPTLISNLDYFLVLDKK